MSEQDAVYDLWPCATCGHESYRHDHEAEDHCDACECECFEEPVDAV